MANAKFDIKTEATRRLYAGVGVADLAVEAVKEYVAEAQKRLARSRRTRGSAARRASSSSSSPRRCAEAVQGGQGPS